MKQEKKEAQPRTRREYAKRGERNQKMMSFRVDLDNIQWLESRENKGRYINQLIAEDRINGGG